MKSWNLLNAVKGLCSVARRLWSPGTNLNLDDLLKMCENVQCQNIFLFPDRNCIGIDVLDPGAASRFMSVSLCPDSRLVYFSVSTVPVFRDRSIPDELPSLLLARNKPGGFYSSLTRESERIARLSVSYTAPMAGMNAGVFGVICQGLCNEAYALDVHLREQGII
jgi:hypothetical protein